jgi:hypothetical protein
MGETMLTIGLMKNTVQHYAWGSTPPPGSNIRDSGCHWLT